MSWKHKRIRKVGRAAKNYYFLFNVLFGPLIGSTKTELPMYKKKKKTLQGPMGGKKKKGCSAILASPPSLAKPHEDKLSQLPRFPHVTHKQSRNPLRVCCRLNHCFLLRSITSVRNRSSCPAHFLVPYIVAYTFMPEGVWHNSGAKIVISLH